MANSDAQTWCSDTLHTILGCSDSALASYLTSIASTASSYKKIISILKEGDVNPIQAKNNNDKERILDKFARDLFQKCHGTVSNNIRTDSSSNVKTKSKKNNADWIKSAATYDLVNDSAQDEFYSKHNGSKSVGDSSVAVISTASSKPIHEIKVKNKAKRKKTSKSMDKKLKYSDDEDGDVVGEQDTRRNDRDYDSKDDKKLKRKRRDEKIRHSRRTKNLGNSSSSDDDDNYHANVDVRRKYEEEKEERRMKREKRMRQQSYSDDSDLEDEDKHHNSDTEDLTPEQRAEKERQQDLKERDEFAKRLLERDKRKTDAKAMDSANDKLKKRVEMEQRLARGEEVTDEATGSTISLKTLREESRRVYLKQRTERELKLLEQELQDEEEMFDRDTLTEAERKRLDLRKKILQMAREDESKKERQENDGFYRLPDEYEEQEGRTKAEKDNALLKSRYIEEKIEKTEQQLWEESQVQKAITNKRSKQGQFGEEKEYDLIFDDQIDFIKTDERKGYDKRNKDKITSRSVSTSSSNDSDSDNEGKAEKTKPLSAHEKILIGRKKLPVYPYREEFLSAVKDHQVLILVGETGSG